MKTTIVNGKTEIIGNDSDIVEIIEKCCGLEFATLVENRLNKPIEITNELKEYVLENSDFFAYENALDNWNFIGNDIMEECEEQIKYIKESKRINKDKLYNAFEKIIKNICEML